MNPRSVSLVAAHFLYPNNLSFCPIICLYVLSYVVLCPLQFPHNNDGGFVCTPPPPFVCRRGYVLFSFLCVFVYIVVSNTSVFFDEDGGCLIKCWDCFPITSNMEGVLYEAGIAFPSRVT